MLTRRSFIKQSTLIACASQIPSTLGASSLLARAKDAVDVANAEIWRRFVDGQDVLLDFTELDGSVSIPTPEECRSGKPNALGWWTPIENGAMFNGFYLDGAIIRAQQTGNSDDKARVIRLSEGLLRLASCSETKGFVGRGFATDGKTTWPMGSNDQTGPFFYGLWRFLRSGFADGSLRKKLEAKIKEVAEVLVETDWRMPAEPPFNFRGTFHGFTWEHAPRLLFLCKVMHQLTGDAVWNERYRTALHEGPGNGGRTRLQDCERGMVFERDGVPKAGRATWTGASSAIALRGLWEMESDETLRTAYYRGLLATADKAVEGLSYRHEFLNGLDASFYGDWRKLNEDWEPQNTPDEAVAVARIQLSAINNLSPRRRIELNYGREAAFAAWVITLCPDRDVVKQMEPEILATISAFNAKTLNFVSFFPVENAWWRLKTLSA